MLTAHTTQRLIEVCQLAVNRLRLIREHHDINSPFTIDALNAVLKQVQTELNHEAEKTNSDSLFLQCVQLGADRAAVAGWPDNKRREFIDQQ